MIIVIASLVQINRRRSGKQWSFNIELLEILIDAPRRILVVLAWSKRDVVVLWFELSQGDLVTRLTPPPVDAPVQRGGRCNQRIGMFFLCAVLARGSLGARAPPLRRNGILRHVTARAGRSGYIREVSRYSPEGRPLVRAVATIASWQVHEP